MKSLFPVIVFSACFGIFVGALVPFPKTEIPFPKKEATVIHDTLYVKYINLKLKFDILVNNKVNELYSMSKKLGDKIKKDKYLFDNNLDLRIDDALEIGRHNGWAEALIYFNHSLDTL